ncbi:MAG TPA: hypothetical protein PLW77_09385 [Bacteroidales bacterium]|nr:hypothetical protein [Bacteroidales bacterium]
MDTIIRFLKDNWEEQINDEQINVDKKDIDKLNKLFENQVITLHGHSQTHVRPQVNQIWAIVNEYFDFRGKKQKTPRPYFVSILTDVEDYEDEGLVRVAVISPFVEMASNQDDVCEDPSIIGFPFLVEHWNDQPILIEILDEYIGYYEPKDISKRNEQLSSIQKEFRAIEISKAKYLNNSVSSLVSFVEQNQENEFGVVVSFNNYSFFQGYPKSDSDKEIVHNEPTIDFTSIEENVFSKSGFIINNKNISFNQEELPFEIQIKKTDKKYIISVFTDEEITLSDNNKNMITQNSNEEKQVFSSLNKGLYTLKMDKNKEQIQIRIK